MGSCLDTDIYPIKLRQTVKLPSNVNVDVRRSSYPVAVKSKT